MEVYDMEGRLLSDAEARALLAKYGLAVSPPPGLQDGQHYFAVTKLWEKTGHHSFVFSVKDIHGDGVHNPDQTLDRSLPHRAFWWRSMGEADDIGDAPYPTDREGEADLGGLDQGHGGSGMGTGAYTGPNEPPEDGPHRAWVRHPTIPSAELVGIRMLGMTNHDHIDAEWQERIYQETSPPPEPPPTPGEPGEALMLLKEVAEKLARVKEILAGLDAEAEAVAAAARALADRT